MNPKTKIKIVLDISMSIILMLLMNTAWTGLLFHEVGGILVAFMFAAHLGINRQWIASMARRFRTPIAGRAKGLFLLNAALAAAMALTLVSGILISEFLFVPLAAGGSFPWMDIHSIASWTSLILLAAHAALHWRWIAGLIKRYAPAARSRVMAARLLIGLLAATAAYSLLTNSTLDILVSAFSPAQASAAQNPGQTAGQAVSGTTDLLDGADDGSTIQSAGEEGKENAAILPSQTETAVSLQEYLSKLRCTACHRHCLLSNPRCGKGTRQAQAAEETYNDNLALVTEQADGV